jgi:hypothetical protein
MTHKNYLYHGGKCMWLLSQSPKTFRRIASAADHGSYNQRTAFESPTNFDLLSLPALNYFLKTEKNYEKPIR